MNNSKDSGCFTRFCILFFIILFFIPVPGQGKDVEIANEFIKAIGDEHTGRFIVKTTGGDPKLKTDQNVLILYEDDPPFSHTTIRIDGKDYIFGSREGKFIQPVAVKDKEIICEWGINDISILQRLRFVKGPTTGREDTIDIIYKIMNNSGKNHDIGVRIVMDTFLGKEDGAPFRIPGVKSIITEKEIIGSKIPRYWYSYDDLVNPTVKAQGTLKIRKSPVPDKVVFASYARFDDYKWDFKIEEGRSYKRGFLQPIDSAVGIFWKPKPVQPKKALTVRTYYGLYGSTLYKGKVFSISLAGPAEVFTTDLFNIYADMQNVSPFKVENVSATLVLPRGLKFKENEKKVKKIGAMKANEMQRPAWAVVPDGTVVDQVNYKVNIFGTLKGKKEKADTSRNIVIKEKEEEKPPEPEPKPKPKRKKKKPKIVKVEPKPEPIPEPEPEPVKVEPEPEPEPEPVKVEPQPEPKPEPEPVKEKPKKKKKKRKPKPKPEPKVETPPLPPPPVKKKEVVKKPVKKTFMPVRIYFDHNRYDIPERGTGLLDFLGGFLKKYDKFFLRIEGHADEVGTGEYNRGLSEKRAKSVLNYLLKKGYIKRSQATCQWFGESRPIGDNSFYGGRLMNRRVEVIMIVEQKE